MKIIISPAKKMNVDTDTLPCTGLPVFMERTELLMRQLQAKLAVEDSKNLYDFWGRSIYEEVLDADRTILNLASKEYSKIVEKYLTGEERFVPRIFGEWKDGKVIQKGTQAKMARGEMVRYMAENRIETLEEIREFRHLDYEFREEVSSETEYIFVKKKGSGL